MITKLIKSIISVFKGDEALTEITIPPKTIPPKVSIAEPILSFVNTVKANPSRFTFEGVVNPKYGRFELSTAYPPEPTTRKYQADKYRRYYDLYKFTDLELGASYEMFIFNEEAYGEVGPNVRAGDAIIKLGISRHATQPNYITCRDERLRFITQLEWLYIEEQLYLSNLTRLAEIADKEAVRKDINQERKWARERIAIDKKNKSQREEYCNIYCKGDSRG